MSDDNRFSLTGQKLMLTVPQSMSTPALLRFTISGSPVKAHVSSPSSPMVMQAFYRRIFPYRPFFLWLNQDHGELSSADTFGLAHSRSPLQALYAPRVRLHPRWRRIPQVQLLCERRRFQAGSLEAESEPIRNRSSVHC